MSPADFEKRWQYDLRHAEQTLLRDGMVAPLFIILGADGRTSLIPADFPDAETKGRFMDLPRLQAIAVDAEAVMLRTESWMVVGRELEPGVAPGHSDRRIEVVSLAATARYGKRVIQRLSAREIVRDGDGKPVGLREVRVPGHDHGALEGAEGPMFDLLPPVRPDREQRELAAAMVEVMKSRT